MIAGADTVLWSAVASLEDSLEVPQNLKFVSVYDPAVIRISIYPHKNLHSNACGVLLIITQNASNQNVLKQNKHCAME
jgi:hypothetical protein